MKNSISQCSKCELISTPRRWSCVKCGIVAQNELADFAGKVAATSTILKSPQSGVKSLSAVSLSISDNAVYFLS